MSASLGHLFSMTDHLDPVLLAKYLAGELVPKERQAIDDWINADPAQRVELEELREVWDRAGEARGTQTANHAAAEMARWSAIQRAIGGQGAAPKRQPTRTIEFPLSHRLARVRRRLVAAAAVIALAVGGGTVWRMARFETPAVQEFVAAVGAPRTIALSDGSRVILAAGSRLTFVEALRSGSPVRHATLDGQAFFAVAHDAHRPFIVTTAVMTTRVLGTEFNVRAYSGDESSSVAVRSGKVGVAVPRSAAVSEKKAVVTPGYEAWVDSVGQIRVRAVDLERTLAWTTGRLEFMGAELASVLRDMNRWYGLQLQLADTSLIHSRVTATFDRVTADDATATLIRLLGPGALVSPSPSGSRR